MKFACPHCTGHLDADAEMAGMRFACPHCQTLIIAPSEPHAFLSGNHEPISRKPANKNNKGRRLLVEGGTAVTAILIVFAVGFVLVKSKKPRGIEAKGPKDQPSVMIAAQPEVPHTDPASDMVSPEPERFEPVEKPARAGGIPDEVLQAERMVIESKLLEMGLCPSAAKLSSGEIQKQSQVALDAATTRWQRLDSLGISTRKPDREAVIGTYTEGIGYVQGKESTTITGALVTLQDRPDLTEEERKIVLEGIAAVRAVEGATPWKRESTRRAALSELDSIGKRVIGVSFRSQTEDAFLDSASSRNAFEIANGEVQARLKNLIGEALKKRGFDKTYGGDTSEEIEVLYSTLGDLDYSRVTSALVASDFVAARKIVNSAEGIEEPKKTRLTAMLQKHENDVVRSGFGKALEATDSVIANNEAIQPMIRDQDASRAVKEALEGILGSP